MATEGGIATPDTGRRGSFILLAVLAALATSCLGIKADLSLAQDGSGTLVLNYRVSKMLSSLDSLGKEQEILPLPLSKAGFEAAAKAAPGIVLESFTGGETRDDVTVDARLSFSSLAALCTFVNGQGERMSFSQAQEGKRLSISFGPRPPQKEIAPELAKLADAAFAPYSIAVTLRLPVPATSQNFGQASETGRRLDYEARVAELVKSPSPPVWDIRWK
jgi:hypothetical protein